MTDVKIFCSINYYNYLHWLNDGFRVTDDETDSSSKKKAKDKPKYGCSYEEIEGRPYHNYSTSWGPKGFTKSNHPFAIMVNTGITPQYVML